MEFNLLPEDCLSHVLSFTSPRDVCRISVVSSTFQSMASSDVIWEKFLPSDYHDIVSRSVVPVKFSSKKELYFLFCNSILIDTGKMVFSLDKFTSKKRYMLSARELSISWGNHPLYWKWKSITHSRFSEVAELLTIWWLEIQGKINTGILSQKTNYAAYLVIKIADRAYGLDFLPSEISVEVNGGHKSRDTAYLRRHDYQKHSLEPRYLLNGFEAVRSRVHEGKGGRVPCERDDGWMEIELGEFYNDSGDREVKMSLMEVKGGHLKAGLIIEGIEIRPKESGIKTLY